MAVPSVSNITWPVNLLGNQLLSGNFGQLANPHVSTEMESGLIRKRKRHQHVPEFRDVSFVFDHTQMGAFEYFLIHELNYGLAWFNYPLADSSGTQTTYTNQVVRFEGLPSWEKEANNLYRVDGQIEVGNKRTITESQWNGLVNPGMEDWSENGDWAFSGMDWAGIDS